jgi:hypothetical protein
MSKPERSAGIQKIYLFFVQRVDWLPIGKEIIKNMQGNIIVISGFLKKQRKKGTFVYERKNEKQN